MKTCPHRIEHGAFMRCRLLDIFTTPSIGEIPGPSDPECICHGCESEWADDVPPSKTKTTPTLRSSLRKFSKIHRTKKGAIKQETRTAECVHLRGVLDRDGKSCHRCHIRGCEIFETTTLNDCRGCQRYVSIETERTDAREKVILHNGFCAGDIVVMTGVLRDLHLRHPGRFKTDVRVAPWHRELFNNNPFVSPIADNDPDAKRINMDLDCDHDGYFTIKRTNEHPQHMTHAWSAGITNGLGIPYVFPSKLGGRIYMTASEREPFPGVGENYWLINAGSRGDQPLKQWPVDRYQSVIDQTPEIQWVQIGASDATHPDLRGVTSMVGQTSHRELIRLMHRASGVLSGVTYLQHLAAAVERPPGIKGLRPAVVVSGGREPISWFGYPGHQILHTIGALDCCSGGGCWKKQPTDCRHYDQGPACMRLIEPIDVVRAIRRYQT